MRDDNKKYKYEAVKSFNAHFGDREARKQMLDLPEAMAYVRDTSDGYIWAAKDFIQDERIGLSHPQVLTSNEIKNMTELEVLKELDEAFALEEKRIVEQ